MHAAVFHPLASPTSRQIHTAAAILYHIDYRFYHAFLLAASFIFSYLHHRHLHHTDGLREEGGMKEGGMKKKYCKRQLSNTIERREKIWLMRMEGVEIEVE